MQNTKIPPFILLALPCLASSTIAFAHETFNWLVQNTSGIFDCDGSLRNFDYTEGHDRYNALLEKN